MIFGILPNIGITELVLILGIVIILFGANKLPGLGKAVGQSIKEFKSSIHDDEEDSAEAEKSSR